MKYYSIAIDGPAGSGKSTVARRVAQHLDFIYVDSGAMYRSVAWYALCQGIDLDDRDKVLQIAQRLSFTLDEQGWLVNGERVTEQLRTLAVSRGASIVAKNGDVRRVLVTKQQEIAKHHHVVMDGRDIGTHVLPMADVKIFLTASIEERAQRRFNEQKKQGYSGDFISLVAEIERRDHQDQNREVSPLIKASDAHLIDTTYQPIAAIVNQIVAMCCTKMGGEE